MARHAKSTSGDKIEDILRNTLRVLCANALPYGSQISIDALIGITVDCSEVILVNVHEQLDKYGDNSSCGDYGSQQLVKTEPYADTVGTELCQQQQKFAASAADLSAYAVSEQAGLCNSSQPFGDILDIAECDDGNGLYYEENYDMEEGQYEDNFQDDHTDETGEQYLTDFCAGVTYDDGSGDADDGTLNDDVKPFNVPASKAGGYYLPTHSSPRGRKRQSTAQSSVGLKGRRCGVGPHAPRRQPKSAVKVEVADYGETGVASSNLSQTKGVSANEKTTVYTCSVCGMMIRHLTTFQRHKQKHEGVVFRCDLCGTVLSRRDVLNVHRKKCEAKMHQQQSSQSFHAM